MPSFFRRSLPVEPHDFIPCDTNSFPLGASGSGAPQHQSIQQSSSNPNILIASSSNNMSSLTCSDKYYDVDDSTETSNSLVNALEQVHRGRVPIISNHSN
eukprot:CAMPEP_0114328554 /NCGR_PEP_ID=MMETSP0101-20121206/481_1 /TAXON_ID=38822 ORGANISM="Pteridomonas danica, Strain PT" /NCGR_SAMPLE_ID=MMETSP0101 /ASSEMBLY_ACC=CAM_ASM_000211 /LENGTH=99 /DNA_ID=CAMNT_0001457909 /DNA_START=750 /DNA_END=1049 /DNA_ORIENTATION=+